MRLRRARRGRRPEQRWIAGLGAEGRHERTLCVLTVLSAPPFLSAWQTAVVGGLVEYGDAHGRTPSGLTEGYDARCRAVGRGG